MSTLRTFFDIDGDMDWAVVSSNTNIVNNKGYIVDTSGGVITLTLPTIPVVGDTIGIKDLANNFGTNNLTIARNGSLIEGVASDKVISHNGYSTEIIYSGATHGWIFNGESYGDITSHLSNTSNPHSVTASQVGLGNVDNTSDANKPVSTLTQSALNAKLDTTSYTASDVLSKIETVDGTNSGLDADLLDGHHSTYFQAALGFTPEDSGNKNATNGYAGLSGGKISASQLPPLAITDTFVVSTSGDMLALAAQVGDVAIRIDLSKSFILQASPSTILSNWVELLSPPDVVTSVAGKTGPVTLNKSDVGLGNVDNTSDANKPVSTATSTAIGYKLDADDPLVKYFHYPLATSVISGGTITINGGDATKIDVAPATILYVDNSNPGSPVLEILTCPQQTAITPPSLATASRLWVGVERVSANTGGIIFSTKFTAEQRRIVAQLGRVRSNGTSTILGVAQYKNQAWGVEKTLEDLMVTLGSLNISGNIYSPVTSTLTLGKDAGTSFRFAAGSGTNMDSSNIVSDVSASPITSYRYHLAANTSPATTVLSTLDVDNYDVSGTLTPVPSGMYTVQRIYLFPGSEATEIVYGQALYSSLQEAVSNVIMESVVITPAQTITLSAGILRGWICAKKGTTNIGDVTKAKIITNTGFGANASSSGSAVSPVDSVNGYTGVVVLNKNDVGLNYVDNTSDVNKPVSTATQTALNGKVDLAFKTISVAGQSDVVADTTADTLTLVAGTNMTITTNAGSDTITFASAGSTGGAGLTWSIKSSDVTVIANTGNFVDTSAGIKTITLPASPAIGDQVGISDYSGTFGTNKCVVARNGKNIMGVAADFDCDINNLGILFVYSDATKGWRTVSLAAGVASSGSGSSLVWNSVSVDTTVSTNNGYFVNTSAAQKTLTLPSTALIGDQVAVVDYAGTFGTYPCIIARNGNKIMGATDNFSCNTNNMGILLTYVDATQGWRITYTAAGAGGASGSGITWNKVAVNTSALVSNGYFVNTTSGQITVTLPSTPNIGDTINVVDYAGTFATNNCIVARNGNKIMGVAEDFNCNLNNLGISLTYVDVTQGWKVINTADGVGAGVSSFPWSLVTSNITSVKSNGYFVNTTSGIITLTLPAAASIGDMVKVTDAAGTFSTNNCTIARNGSNIMGAASNYVANTNNLNLEFTYCSVALGWRITSKSVGT